MTSQETPTGGSITSRPSSSGSVTLAASAVRAPRRSQQDVAILEQHLALELRRRRRPHRREGQIERARGDALEQERLVELLANLHANLGPAPAELADHAREDARAGRLEGADADGPGLARDELVEVGAQGAEPCQQAVGVPQHDLARLGQRNGPRAARALDSFRPTARSSAAICCETADCA